MFILVLVLTFIFSGHYLLPGSQLSVGEDVVPGSLLLHDVVDVEVDGWWWSGSLLVPDGGDGEVDGWWRSGDRWDGLRLTLSWLINKQVLWSFPRLV